MDFHAVGADALCEIEAARAENIKIEAELLAVSEIGERLPLNVRHLQLAEQRIVLVIGRGELFGVDELQFGRVGAGARGGAHQQLRLRGGAFEALRELGDDERLHGAATCSLRVHSEGFRSSSVAVPRPL